MFVGVVCVCLSVYLCMDVLCTCVCACVCVLAKCLYVCLLLCAWMVEGDIRSWPHVDALIKDQTPSFGKVNKNSK